MTAVVASSPVIIKSSKKGWKQCSCCPYGYHIDLDFVRYCENVINSQVLPRAIGVSRKLKKRASMDVLLGLPNNHGRYEEKHGFSATWDGLDQAVQDFELTLQRTSKKTQDSIPKKRNIAVGTSIITRDVGVNHKLPLTSTCGVMTEDYNPPRTTSPVVRPEKDLVSSSCQTEKYYEVSLGHRSSQTVLKMDTVYSAEDLERNIDKAIKLYEKTFHHLLRPKKPSVTNSGVQVDTKSSLCRDYSVQVQQETSSQGTSFRPDCTNTGTQTRWERVRTRDVAVSDDTVVSVSCDHSPVQTKTVGTMTYKDQAHKLYSLGPRSNTLDYFTLTKKTSRNVAIGPDKSVCSSKSTDTVELNTKKDVAVNTAKNKLVDAAVGPSPRPPTLTRKRGSCSFSKIPRPVPYRRPTTFSRQLTYLASPTLSRKSFGREGFDYESESEDGEYSLPSIKTDNSRPLSPEPVFQPIRVPDLYRVRKELGQEMKGAFKVLNDGLANINDGNPPYHLRNALTLAQQEWFKVSSSQHADPVQVEDYLDCFEEFSTELLNFTVNMVDNTGNTALHYAVSHGRFDVVSILLDSKVCDINKKNAAGYTCIMLVSLAEVNSITHRQVVRRLFQLADVNSRAKQHGQTALMLAVSHGRMDMVELLLDSGADINIQDDDGSTALMCAAEHGHIDIVKFILAQPECDLTITDCDGNTALNIAMEAGNRDIGVLLYAQQHFSRGGSPYSSFKSKKPTGSSGPSRTSPLNFKKN